MMAVEGGEATSCGMESEGVEGQEKDTADGTTPTSTNTPTTTTNSTTSNSTTTNNEEVVSKTSLLSEISTATTDSSTGTTTETSASTTTVTPTTNGTSTTSGANTTASITGTNTTASITGTDTATSITDKDIATSITDTNTTASITGTNTTSSITGTGTSTSTASSSTTVTGPNTAIATTTVTGNNTTASATCTSSTTTTSSTVSATATITGTGTAADGEREEEAEEEHEEDGEFVEEDFDESKPKPGCTTGRVVTLQMLLAADILQPGEGTMSIEYLGQRFMGDLLPDGKIKSLETDIVFASPSAWAIHCKRIINPEKKSGCGWASVRYKGTKLEIYKTRYFNKKISDQNKENENTDEEEIEMKAPAPYLLKEIKDIPPPAPVPRIVVKHSVLGNRSSLHDGNLLVESTPFSTIGKIQPFLVSLATNAALVMDLHCHLTTSEVVGYLAGYWDVNGHNLAITHAFPCRCRLGDKESAPMMEAEICKALEQRRLTLVGWYHSHPYAPATPTIRDIDSQLEYEIKMKGNNDASYTPCVGFICSPYHKENTSLESVMTCYWVIPPPENKPNEYGKPMMMSYSVLQDQYLSKDALTEMKKCAEFYKVDQDFVNFSEKFKNGVSFLEKLKTTLNSKMPRDQADGSLWNYLSELLCAGSTGVSTPPKITTPPPHPLSLPSHSFLVPSSLPINIPSTSKSAGGSLLGAELANALFGSGKFPSPASLMSLSSIFPAPQPVSNHSTKSILKSSPSPAKISKTEDSGTSTSVSFPIHTNTSKHHSLQVSSQLQSQLHSHLQSQLQSQLHSQLKSQLHSVAHMQNQTQTSTSQTVPTLPSYMSSLDKNCTVTSKQSS
ncbi:MPN domain-containing protein CG4751 [Nilaparvata lugens]|uniref:MPN domain-containing protein CG4751 n=1 Tax=Nilaparvata lugens TaxID=108931 RepID=UPI00193E7B70|nr:MPN domain-containing protein CG4751 [Nilaparvata lugens]XP_039279086.1 MPN domain-containing protein CG4751 [Nilaparvata lugens]